ncbi:hypothetical protein PCE1_003065 [Barthelona sp. PCE]
MTVKEVTYTLEEKEMDIDEEDDFIYEAVSLEDEEDMDDRTLLSMTATVKHNELTQKPIEPVTESTTRHEVLDDFIRNTFTRFNMTKSLAVFQQEWYEMLSRGEIDTDSLAVPPDVYYQNSKLHNEIAILKKQLVEAEEKAEKAQSTWDRFRKQRDHFKLQHNRVVQEKNSLVRDIKRLKKHYEQYPELVEDLQTKHKALMKEKSLAKMQVGKLKNKLTLAEHTIKTLQSMKSDGSEPKTTRQKKVTPKAEMFEEAPYNPHLEHTYGIPSSLSEQNSFTAHNVGVSSIAAHPKQELILTSSDDTTWKMWTVPTCEHVLTGSGHQDWLGDVSFSPRGTQLVSASGDGVAIVWDIREACKKCVLKGHTAPIWSVDWHYTGNFVATASMDQTVKIWDTIQGTAFQTLRGHVDSVNSVRFAALSNTCVTASADKTISLWDARIGQCVHTLFGHTNAVNYAEFTLQGNLLASCDADGQVKVFDVRTLEEMFSFDCGPHSVNSLSWHRSGKLLAAACDDLSVRVFDIEQAIQAFSLGGHNDTVQDVLFYTMPQSSQDVLLSASSDGIVKVWG